MATITTRAGKGSPLTNDEVDANFTNLNTDKAELSGASFTGNVSFGDNDKAIFGAGSDLQIYHDGSNSYIGEFGTGSLRIRSNQIRMEAPDSQNMIIVTEDAGVQAFYNGTQRFQVTNTGIDVTGTAVTDGVTVAGDYNQSRTAGTFFTLTDTTNSKTGYINWESDAFNIFTHGPVKRLTIDSSGTEPKLCTCVAIMNNVCLLYTSDAADE